MNPVFILTSRLTTLQLVSIGTEIGPEGHKLLWIIGILVLAILTAIFILNPLHKTRKFKYGLPRRKKISIQLEKDRLYYPNELKLIVTNTGGRNVDINKPVLVFSSIWLKRKFIIKGTNNYNFYPLYLQKGQTHSLNIDLNRFYRHDKSLKKLPHAKISIYEVQGKKLGSQKVLLRKTLLNF